MTPIERFWAGTRASGRCVEWTRAPGRDGYGKFKIDGRTIRAHRWIYAQALGEIPPSKMILHSCDNRMCVTLQHLSIGTAKDNYHDASSRGRVVGNVRLTSDQVVEIRASSETGSELARRFSVTPSCISRIRLRKTWKEDK